MIFDFDLYHQGYLAAYFMDYIHTWHKYNPWGDNVSCSIPGPEVESQGHTGH